MKKARSIFVAVCGIGVILVFLLTAFKAVGRPDLSVFAAISGVGAIAFVLARKRRLQVSVSVLGAVVALYAAEFVLHIVEHNKPASIQERIHARMEELRAEGKRAFPAMGIQEYASEQGLIPLSGISNSWTVLPPESGGVPVYLSDEFGFNNPEGWSRNQSARTIALVGDSFVEGR